MRANKAQFQWYVDQLTFFGSLILVVELYAVGIQLGLV